MRIVNFNHQLILLKKLAVMVWRNAGNQAIFQFTEPKSWSLLQLISFYEF